MQQINVNVSGGGKLTSEEIDALYNAMKDGLMDDASVLVGQCTSDACYEDAATALHERFPQFSIDVLKYFVRFKDPEVLRVLLANGVGKDGGITADELAKVTSIGTWFKNNTSITSFDEINDTNIKTIAERAFQGCTGIKDFIWYKIESLGNALFEYCNIDRLVAYKAKSLGGGMSVPFYNGGSCLCIFLPSLKRLDGGGGFNLCWNLSNCKLIDFGKQLESSANNNLSTASKSSPYFVFRSNTAPRGLSDMNNALTAMFVPQGSDYSTVSCSKMYFIGGTEWQSAMRTLATQYAAEYAGWSAEQIATADYSDPYIDYRIFGLEPPTE